MLAIPDGRTYITVEPEQTAESYTVGFRRKYITVLILSGAYGLLYAAAWCVAVWLRRGK